MEKRPIAENLDPEVIAAYERELAALQNSVSEQRAALQSSLDEQSAQLQENLQAQTDKVQAVLSEARAIEEAALKKQEAAEAARAEAARIAVVNDFRTAAESGQPFADELAALTDAGMSAPDPLPSMADSGVPTLVALVDGFPSVARDALAAARSEDTDAGGLGDFVKRQLGARSVAPRDGDDPDAVLSRAEAAVLAGNLPGALEEIAALPSAAQSVLADWVATAQTRLDALAAIDTLAQAQTSN